MLNTLSIIYVSQLNRKCLSGKELKTMKKTYKTLTAILSIVMILTVMCQPIEASAKSAKPVVKATQTVISKGTTTKVKAMSGKKNVTNKAKFKSSNKKVATVNKKGVVTGKKGGTAYLTATYKGKTSKKVKITVAQISLNKTSLKLTAGKTVTLTAKYNKKKVNPTFKSSNPNVASVNKNGKITAKKKGTATITATYKKSKASCKVTVSKAETGCASGHAWDAGVITKEPTDTESGVKTYTCTRCGETKTENGHYEKKKVKDAWDEEKLEAAIVCNQCGKRFSETEYGSIEKALDAFTNHVFESWDTGGNCDNYSSDDKTITIHHPAEYKDVWVADK